MLLFKRPSGEGIWFAWKWVDTPDGVVWLEYVRYKWHDSEFGGYSYERLKGDWEE